MSRIVRIVVWAIILFAFYFFISTMFKSCGDNRNNDRMTSQDTEEVSDSMIEDTGDAFFEDAGDEFESVEEEPPSDAVEKTTHEEDDGFEEPISSSAVEKPVENKPTPKPVKKDPPKTKPATTQNNNSSLGKFHVITGSFSVKVNAQNMVSKLKNLGYSGASIVVFNSSQYHSVSAGRYSTKGEANSACSNLKSSGTDCYVHRIN